MFDFLQILKSYIYYYKLKSAYIYYFNEIIKLPIYINLMMLDLVYNKITSLLIIIIKIIF